MSTNVIVFLCVYYNNIWLFWIFFTFKAIFYFFLLLSLAPLVSVYFRSSNIHLSVNVCISVSLSSGPCLLHLFSTLASRDSNYYNSSSDLCRANELHQVTEAPMSPKVSGHLRAFVDFQKNASPPMYCGNVQWKESTPEQTQNTFIN